MASGKYQIAPDFVGDNVRLRTGPSSTVVLDCIIASYTGLIVPLRNPLTGKSLNFTTSGYSVSYSALTINTLYYVYLDFDPAVAALKTSTSAPTFLTSQELGYGADADELFVGAFYLTTGPAITTTGGGGASHHIMSYFTPRPLYLWKAGAAQGSITANNNYQTPSTDMVLSYIRHPRREFRLFGIVNLYHNSAGSDVWCGIDVGASGTPFTGSTLGNRRTSGSTEYGALKPEAVEQAGGGVARRQSRILVAGQSSGTFEIQQVSGGQVNGLHGSIFA